MPLLTEEQKLEKKLLTRFQKAIYEYGLIEDNDHILVGLSGGKDSLCLLELLGKRMKIDKPKFTVEALHIRMSNIKYESDITYLKDFAESRGIRFHVVTTEFNASTDSRKSPCFLCSWNRRKQLFMKAKELGCNKIALGHHMDDIIHTTMMNLYFQGSFSTMPVRLKMKKMPLTIIRPLCLEIEEDLRKYAANNNYHKQVKLCPYETDSHRSDMRDMFNNIESMTSEARYSVWNALEKEGKLIEE
ncbi:MAG: ATP-binding protein [Prevotellaceae bacterium]|nr:ATP-binding protein [Prevotellaceae bacterium]